LFFYVSVGNADNFLQNVFGLRSVGMCHIAYKFLLYALLANRAALKAMGLVNRLADMVYYWYDNYIFGVFGTLIIVCRFVKGLLCQKIFL